MKKAKSLLAIILCLAMLFTFAGCGEQQTVSTFTETEDEWETEVIEGEENITGGEQGEMINTTVSQGDSATTAALAKNKEFLKSLKGLEINIVTMQSEKPLRGTRSGDRYFSILDKVAKQYGVTINYLNKFPGDLQQSILAGNPSANVIGIQDYQYASWLNAGVAADLSSAMQKTGITFKESWYKPSATMFGNLNGKQYAFNADIYEPHMLIYNKRMIQESGLKDPIDLYASGDWTFDRLVEYLNKLTKKSADGKVIINGLGLPNASILAAFLIGMNGEDVFKIQNGEFVSNVTSTKVKNALQYLAKFYYVDKVAAGTANWSESYTNFSKGKTAMVLATKYIFDNMYENNMTDAVGVVPFPYGPDASSKTKYMYNQLFLNVIPKSEQKNADKILFIMNEVYKQQYLVREDDFMDSYRTLIRDNKSYNVFKDFSLGNEEMRFSYYNISGLVYGKYEDLRNLAGDVCNGTAVETAIKANTAMIDTNIAEQWGKWKIAG